MNILLNFYPVQVGGGQQVASGFLKVIAQNDHGHNWFIFVGEGSELHKLAKQLFSPSQIFSFPYSYSKRMRSAKVIRNYIDQNKIDIIYNYAPTLPVSGVPQVVRTVYSNLYFPEINFWKDYKFNTKLKKKVIDYFRLKHTLRADGLIFENQSMQERAVELFSYPKKNTKYIEPSVSPFDEKQINPSLKSLENLDGFKVLYLSSWHLNKKIDILPEVSRILSGQGVNVKFILSLSPDNKEVNQYLIPLIQEKNVGKNFKFIGKVEAVNVHQAVKNSNAMILLSKLECFSSNVIEAFHFKKPLIISNEPWARSACGKAAQYVDRESATEIAAAIANLVKNPDICKQLTDLGTQNLSNFNSSEEKVAKQIQFLELIYESKKSS